MIRPLSLGLVAGLLLFSAGCAYVPLPPLSAERNIQTLEPDEQHLWKESREIQHKIEISGLLLDDPELDAYIERVLRRIAIPELRAASLEPKVRIIEDVNIHGYSFANGVIYIHTALLSRMQDETQLAILLSRELAHITHRHALRSQRDKRATADTLAWVGVGSSLVEGGGDYKLLIQAAAMTSAVGFHHSLETTADEKGLKTLAEAGYDVSETPAFYEMTLDHLGKVHTQGPWAWLAYAAPPHMTARIAGYRTLIDRDYADQASKPGGIRPPVARPDEFRRKVHKATLRQAELEMAAGLFLSAADSAALATESGPRDPEAWSLLGRALYAQRTKPIQNQDVPSLEKVRSAFEEALRIDSRNPAATRELGMTYYRSGGGAGRSAEDRLQAKRLLTRYLALKPQANDADYIRGYLKQLD